MLTWAEGQHNVTIWANDSVNNVNQSSVRFTIDSLGPTITIAYPTSGLNLSYNTSIGLNYSASDLDGVYCWYNINNGANVSLGLILLVD